MASFGHVLDLLDERYLAKVQDVIGNVEPMPKLVPYEEYKHNVLVYRIDTDHDKFIMLMHDFTDRMSTLLGKELWTWNVQWEVDSCDVSVAQPKKPRLQDSHSQPTATEPKTEHRKPIIDHIGRCVIDPELIQEEEMLRILINIVQAESSLVPNVIEWLYQWIDFYEGDGTALKAALKWEIPSLWDFDYHPLLLPEEMKTRWREEQTRPDGEMEVMHSITAHETGSKTTLPDSAQEQSSTTKRMREKPDLAALERRMRESERLKYGEVRFGIRPPKTEDSIPPLINIPQNESQRTKYYDACYRSRHRALVLLLEAGISLQQISNYVKLQKPHPRDTSQAGDPRSLDGLKHYRKDAEAAQDFFRTRGKLQLQPLKQNEVATSINLEIDAQQTAPGGSPQRRPRVPLIAPPPPVYTRPDSITDVMGKLEAARAKAVDTVNFIPTVLVGRLKSKYLARARGGLEHQPADNSRPYHARGVELERENHGDVDIESGSEDDDEDSNSDTDDSSDDGNDEPGDSRGLPSASVPQSIDPTLPFRATQAIAQPPIPNFGGYPTTGASTIQFTPAQAEAIEYMQSLTDEEAREFVPRLEQSIRNILATRARANPPANASLQANASTMQPSWFPDTQPTSMSTMSSTEPTPQMTSAGITSRAIGQPQTHGAPMPLRPPTLSRPIARPIASNLQQPSWPGQTPPARSATVPSAPGTGRWSLDQFQINPRVQPLPTTGNVRPNLPHGLGPSSGTQPGPSSNNGTGYGAHPHPLRPSGYPPGFAPTPPVFRSPSMIGTANPSSPVNRNPMIAPQANPQQNYTNTTGPSRTVPAFPPPSPGRNFNVQHLLALQQQHDARTKMHQQHYGGRALDPWPQSGQVMQPQRLSGMQQNGALNTRPYLSWGAAPTTPQRAAVPTLPMTTPQSPVSQPPREHPIVQNERNRTIQALFRVNPQNLIPNTPPPNNRIPPQVAPPQPMSHAPLPSINRTAPTPLTLRPSNTTPGPLTSLADSILATTPFRTSAQGTPVQLYFPKIVIPGNGLGPGGTKLGDNHFIETDAMLLGYTIPGSGKVTLTRALFMPLGCWTNTLKRARLNHADVLETYPSNFNGLTGQKFRESFPCHRAAYEKLVQAFAFMTRDARRREHEVTKRWRATRGPMTQRDRGAVWEGWGVSIDRPIEMSEEDREGVMRMKWVVDEASELPRSKAEQVKWEEMEEFMELEDEDMYGDDMEE